MNRITHIPVDGLPVVHGETGAPGTVIDTCDGYRVRVQWELTGRITRVTAAALRVPPAKES